MIKFLGKTILINYFCLVTLDLAQAVTFVCQLRLPGNLSQSTENIEIQLPLKSPTHIQAGNVQIKIQQDRDQMLNMVMDFKDNGERVEKLFGLEGPIVAIGRGKEEQFICKNREFAESITGQVSP